jgi:hypothetical protein
LDAHWWQLPGPGRFVASVLSDLRSGRNVLLRFPLHTAGGIREAVEAEVRANDLWRWAPLDATEFFASTPAELALMLHDRLHCEPPPGQLPGPAALARAIPDGEVLWVEHLGAGQWPVWARFLAQFQHACVPLVGRLPTEPDSDTALAVHRWGRSLTRLDVMLYLDRRAPTAFPSRTLRQVALAVATELGGADAGLGVRLASIGVQLLADPLSVLGEHASERGWTQACVERPAWHDGVIERLDGEERVNSAALLAAGDHEAVRRRVWKGQVRVLYPFIEEQRVRLVPEVNRFLRFPLETTYGTVERAIDLEIGQLVHFLRGQRLPDLTRRQLLVLCNMRHSLAHLRPVAFRDLISPEFQLLDKPN